MPNRPPPRPALTQFARILLTLGSGESFLLIGVFILGVTMLGVFSNFIFTMVFSFETLTGPAILRVVIALAVMVAVAYGAYQYYLRIVWRTRPFSARFYETDIMEAHAGVIWLMSKGRIELPVIALKHHAQWAEGERLQHCWVLVTPDAQEAYNRLAAHLPDIGLNVQLHLVPIKKASIEATFRAVENIYQKELTEAGLEARQVVADITGGQKPMSAGMVLACLPYGYALEYVESTFDETGKIIEGSQRVVRAGVNFQVNV